MVEEGVLDKFYARGMEGVNFANGICKDCKHVHEGGETCEAFPDGIPIVIQTGEFDHHEHYPGDDGVTFEEAE